jgi:predicted hotdog family 3-hydroxylacyl-ACP dehydratase
MQNLQNPIINTDSILNYIPQRPPFVLISRIYNCNGKEVVSGFDISDNHILIQNSKLTESGIVENMAQTAASMAGYSSINNGKNPSVGFIGNIKNLVINFLPSSGTVLYTQVITKTQVMNVSIIEANSFSNNQLVATCEMKIFLQEDL